MPEYVLNRTHLFQSTLGHTLSFVKGKPAYVPPILEREVAAIGGERVDGKRVELLDDPTPEQSNLGAEERAALITEAFKVLIEKNDSKDFTAAGVPTVKAVERELGIDVDRVEVVDAWNAMKAEG